MIGFGQILIARVTYEWYSPYVLVEGAIMCLRCGLGLVPSRNPIYIQLGLSTTNAKIIIHITFSEFKLSDKKRRVQAYVRMGGIRLRSYRGPHAARERP